MDALASVALPAMDAMAWRLVATMARVAQDWALLGQGLVMDVWEPVLAIWAHVAAVAA